MLVGWIIRLKLLISGGVERRLHLDLTVFKGQGHYPPFPGLFVCLIKRAGVLPASLFESSGGAVFNWLWGPVLISGFFVDSVS